MAPRALYDIDFRFRARGNSEANVPVPDGNIYVRCAEGDCEFTFRQCTMDKPVVQGSRRKALISFLWHFAIHFAAIVSGYPVAHHLQNPSALVHWLRFMSNS